jgi:prephenate dehydratase
VRVAYLGPAGTYSEEALRASAPGPVEEIPYPTIYDTVMAVHDGEVDRAVVPIENSLEGAVAVTLDTLALEATDVRIVAEVVHPIHHCVVAGHEFDLAEVTRVVSHPQATAQCRRFLRERLAQAELVVAPSTADAVLSVRDSSTPDVALASRLAAELRELADRGVNLTRIESRPRRTSLGHYMFFIDLEGGAGEPVVHEALEALRAQVEVLRILGSYTIASGGPG